MTNIYYNIIVLLYGFILVYYSRNARNIFLFYIPPGSTLHKNNSFKLRIILNQSVYFKF